MRGLAMNGPRSLIDPCRSSPPYVDLTHERTVGPAVVYCHPWEISAEARSLPGTPRYVSLWKRLGLRRMRPALERLLATFPFRAIREVYAPELDGGAEVAARGGNGRTPGAARGAGDHLRAGRDGNGLAR